MALQSQQHPSKIPKACWRSGKMADWTIKVGCVTYPVHRTILGLGSRFSEFFYAKFTVGTQEALAQSEGATTDLSFLPSRCQDIFPLYLDWVYVGILKVTRDEDIAPLLQLGEQMLCYSLNAECVKHVQLKTHWTNILYFYRDAIECNQETLRAVACEGIARNLEKLIVRNMRIPPKSQPESSRGGQQSCHQPCHDDVKANLTQVEGLDVDDGHNETDPTTSSRHKRHVRHETAPNYRAATAGAALSSVTTASAAAAVVMDITGDSTGAAAVRRGMPPLEVPDFSLQEAENDDIDTFFSKAVWFLRQFPLLCLKDILSSNHLQMPKYTEDAICRLVWELVLDGSTNKPIADYSPLWSTVRFTFLSWKAFKLSYNNPSIPQSFLLEASVAKLARQASEANFREFSMSPNNVRRNTDDHSNSSTPKNDSQKRKTMVQAPQDFPESFDIRWHAEESDYMQHTHKYDNGDHQHMLLCSQCSKKGDIKGDTIPVFWQERHTPDIERQELEERKYMLRVGTEVDVQCRVNQRYYLGTVVAIAFPQVLIHFNSWHSKWNEWIHVADPRIQQRGKHTQSHSLEHSYDLRIVGLMRDDDTTPAAGLDPARQLQGARRIRGRLAEMHNLLADRHNRPRRVRRVFIDVGPEGDVNDMDDNDNIGNVAANDHHEAEGDDHSERTA